MRISTNTLYELGVSSMQDRVATLAKIQQQLATGRKIVTPSDDPIGASAQLTLSQSIGLIDQYKANITRAQTSLKLEETVLAGVSEVIQAARGIAIGIGGGAPANSTLQGLAEELRGRYQELLALANTKDAQGQYLFAGYQGATAPFAQTSGPAVYVGDQGQRNVQISSSRQIPIADSGQAVFGPGIAGQDVFATLDTFITQLSSGSITTAQLSAITLELDAQFNNVQTVRGAVSGRLRELDATSVTHTQSKLEYQTALSAVQDLDYTKAITELTQVQTSLEAAQKSYVSVQQLSLFNYIGN